MYMQNGQKVSPSFRKPEHYVNDEQFGSLADRVAALEAAVKDLMTAVRALASDGSDTKVNYGHDNESEDSKPEPARRGRPRKDD